MRARIRGHKYNAQRTVIDGISFASKAEARRFAELKLMVKAGEIRDLELQPKYPLIVNGQTVASYTADFRYRHNRDGFRDARRRSEPSRRAGAQRKRNHEFRGEDREDAKGHTVASGGLLQRARQIRGPVAPRTHQGGVDR